MIDSFAQATRSPVHVLMLSMQAVRAWSFSPACTWHYSSHYFFLQAIPLFPRSWYDHTML